MKKSLAVGKWDIRSLGEGAFGEVYHCKNRNTGQEIATKRLKTNHLLKPDEIEVMKRRWRQEYDWIQSLEKTPFIVDAVQINDSDFMNYLRKQNESIDLPIIIMEYCNGGDLRDHLQKVDNFNGLPEFEVRNVLFSIRHAIEYLHEKCNIEHRDIKPENIVIQKIENNKKLFKLTDFGYAKDIPDSTVAQSVVGTRHYVAPEVVDPGNYTQTVDYWSIGVMAFEIMCGIQPFIPHQNFKNIMTNIHQKPNDCIAITQMIDEPITDRFQFHKNIYKENHLSDIFVPKIEKWLQLSLDKNYRTRGYRKNQLKFYADLDNILQTKILTVFCLKNYKIFYYDIEQFGDMGDFLRTLQKDTKILSLKNIYYILPTGHPKHRLINIRNPIDFFVSDWCDTSNLDNPHVMLYIADKTQCDFNAKLEDINISATIKKMMNKDAHDFMSKYNKNNELNWLLKQFERHVHFVISKQQYLAECYVKGLYEFILEVEDVVFKYQPLLSKIYEDSLILSGRVIQFADTVQHYAKTNTKEFSWLNTAEEHSKECYKLRDDIVKKVKIRFDSVLNHCKDLASRDIYKTFPNRDVFKLQEYRNFLILQHQPVERMEKCQLVFESFVQHGFESFIANSELKCIRESIQKQHNIFSKICELVKDIQERVEKMSNKLNQDTENLMLTISSGNTDPILALKMNSLCIDGTDGTPASLSHVFMNGHCSLGNGEAFDASTAQVLEESKSLLSLINSSMMEIDEDISMREDLPTTIQNI